MAWHRTSESTMMSSGSMLAGGGAIIVVGAKVFHNGDRLNLGIHEDLDGHLGVAAHLAVGVVTRDVLELEDVRQ